MAVSPYANLIAAQTQVYRSASPRPAQASSEASEQGSGRLSSAAQRAAREPAVLLRGEAVEEALNANSAASQDANRFAREAPLAGAAKPYACPGSCVNILV
ncbi:MAG: hypothetical protein HXY22_13110 [Alphaproteobacteria bacterium]|nr:hypothetical protein [Alphaproteobacteria bacterium]